MGQGWAFVIGQSEKAEQFRLWDLNCCAGEVDQVRQGDAVFAPQSNARH